ncbi:HAMP domain-containing histidine kinase [Kribbella qitaiheensis]|uniref:histidine kinase n=1 Tax=Kribbella qitaiheensis TaxID=1544730 RepID=A0A7G6X8U2_9ACTN|nr:HAMP domain-containing sensor histidine kinase [Kribbella qitaiheensis]QNE22657.1 HAMP domain-containing histidine kinase [Kribbella qitaiheensis]
MTKRRPARRSIGDDILVRTAARRLAAQAAGMVALAMLLLVLLVTVVVVRGQSVAADDLLRSTARTADDVGDPPPSAWLVMTRAGVVTATPGLPGELTVELARLRVGAKPQPVLTNLAESGDHDMFRVATRQRGGQTVQVVLDLTSAHQERTRLLKAMGVASVIGLLFAVLLGVLFGRRAVRPLAQALTLQRTFIADAGHELRTPLTLLTTRAQLLNRAVRSGDFPDQTKADSQGVVLDAQRLGEVVEDLLAAADPRGQETREALELSELVQGVVDSARAHAADRGVELLADVGEPPAGVSGSATALRRAVLSLVDNAIDHTPAGGQVRIAVRRERRLVVVTVSDTGPGIAPEAADQVLRRFHSGEQRAGRAHYGLGLALSHDVANRHGGQLRLVESQVGATFELSLPRLPDRPPQAPRNP